MKQITSIQNPLVKSLVQLQEKAKARRESGTFLIEGQREIGLAVKGGYEILTVLFVPEMYNPAQLSATLAEFIQISHEVYEKLAYRDTTEGVLAVAQSRKLTLENLN